MSRLILLAMASFVIVVGAVIAGDARKVDWHTQDYFKVNVDTVGATGIDTTDDGRNYYDKTIPIIANAPWLRSGKFRIIVGAASPIVHGFGNDDSVKATLTTSAANFQLWTTTASAASIPCTLSFTLTANDTLYGDEISVTLRAVDSTADTAFTTYYPITVQGIFRGY
ncbi:MAG: hypothetical protein WC565_09030 [Parcubacteria group bacterium]|jgi:hypothetical protein